MPRARTREEFVDLLEIELAAEENAPWPGNCIDRQKAADRALRAARWAKAEADRTVGL